MQKSIGRAKDNKQKDMSKQLMSKLYFSRTQENYLKLYGNSQNYLQQLSELMSKACKKKLLRIVEEVKQQNNVFCKYLQKKHIQKLTIQDVSCFEETLQTQNKKIMNNVSSKTDCTNLKQLNNQIIRIGFMMITEKLSNQRLNNIINETKYLKETLQRDKTNLQNLGYEYLGIECLHNLRDINQDISFEEKENGSFKLINSKVREQASTIYEVQNYLNSITMK